MAFISFDNTIIGDTIKNFINKQIRLFCNFMPVNTDKPTWRGCTSRLRLGKNLKEIIKGKLLCYLDLYRDTQE